MNKDLQFSSNTGLMRKSKVDEKSSAEMDVIEHQAVVQLPETRKEKLGRPLGLLETMYHVYYSRGVDMYAQMANVTCQRAVKNTEVVSALQCLVKKHPLLRMCIKERMDIADLQHRYYFEEMNYTDFNINEVFGDDNEAILRRETKRKYDNRGPMWRFTRVWNDLRKRESGHYFRFMFSCHHAIIDGVYLGLLFADFFEFLDLIQRRLLCVHDVKESSLWPAIENLVPKATATKIRRIERVVCTGVPSSIENTCDALEAYEHCFHSEIALLSKEKMQTSTNRFRVPIFESARIITECKEKRSTVTGAAIAAACRAFGLLLQPYLPDDVQVLDVPIEVMVNLRRYVANENIFDSYPGVAAIHVPITVRIPVKENLLSQDVFWYLARQCSDELRNIIASYEPIRQLSKETKEEINAPKKSGKSKYVICLTNLSNIDGVVKSEQSDRFTLTEFPGCTNLAMDDMPIFYIGMYSMRGELHFDIGHCAGYTSPNTASAFCRELVRCLSLKSKL